MKQHLLVAASLLFACPSLLVAQTCKTDIPVLRTGAVFSQSLLDEAQEISPDGGVRPIVLLARVADMNNDGVRDVASIEGANFESLVIRDGSTMLELRRTTLPAGAIPTQLGSIGDYDGDGVEEYVVGVRYPGANQGPSVMVYDGRTGNLIQTFPQIISGLPKARQQDPTYPFGIANRSGVSAQVVTIAGNKTLVYGDSNANMLIWKQLCMINDVVQPCYTTRAVGTSNGVASSQLGARMSALSTFQGNTLVRELRVFDPSASIVIPSHGPVPAQVLEQTGAMFGLDPSGETLTMLKQGREPHARFGFDVQNIGDVDGDGVQDFIVGSPADGRDEIQGGDIDIVGGALSRSLKFISAGPEAEGGQPGYSVSGGVDLTADGRADIVVGVPGEKGDGRVRVYDGKPRGDKVVRFRLAGDSHSVRFGHSVVVTDGARVIVADAAGRVFHYQLGGKDQASFCSKPHKRVLPKPVQNDIDKLYQQLKNITGKLGQLNVSALSSRVRSDLLRAINSSVNKAADILDSGRVQPYATRLGDSAGVDLRARLAELNVAYASGSAAARQLSRRRLVSLGNNLLSKVRPVTSKR